jgi:ribosomal protein S18 acetylase RimI-like enzyme
MEYKLLEKDDLELMKEIIEDDDMEFELSNLTHFLQDNNNYGFIAKENNKIIGFIYGYSLLKPNGKYMFYVHSVGVLPNYQGKGIGKELFKYMVEYLENEKKSYKYFLLTAEDNIIAQKLYRKYSTKECLQIYFEKNF